MPTRFMVRVTTSGCDICFATTASTQSWDAKSVSVKEAERIQQITGSPVGLTLAFTHAHDVELLVIRHQDGREEYMDEVWAQVIPSWNAIFDQDKL